MKYSAWGNVVAQWSTFLLSDDVPNKLTRDIHRMSNLSRNVTMVRNIIYYLLFTLFLQFSIIALIRAFFFARVLVRFTPYHYAGARNHLARWMVPVFMLYFLEISHILISVLSYLSCNILLKLIQYLGPVLCNKGVIQNNDCAVFDPKLINLKIFWFLGKPLKTP